MNPMSPIDRSVGDEVFGSPGYSTRFGLSKDELTFLHGAIEKQWRETIFRVRPDTMPKLGTLPIHRYHEIASLVDHQALWTKANRMLSQRDIHELQRMPFLARIREELGDCRISGSVYEDGRARPDLLEVHWRLVRPNVATDIGALHADSWYHAVQGSASGLFARDEYTVKMWIAVVTEPGKNGLCVVPDSHTRHWDFGYVRNSAGNPRPQLRDRIDSEQLVLLSLEPGQFVLFNDKLIHVGAINCGEHTRISAEITLVFKHAHDNEKWRWLFEQFSPIYKC